MEDGIWSKEFRLRRLDWGEVFRIALLLKLGQEIVLLQRSAASQKLEQRVFQFLSGLVGGFKLV